jgi:ATP-dependent helicase/nuclease subunit A
MKDAERAERDRLLYVAMTRAEKWLIVAAAGELGNKGDSWYEKIETGMRAANAVPNMFDAGEGLRLGHGNWALPAEQPPSPDGSVNITLPDYFHQPSPAITPKAATLSPSDLGGAKALPGEGLDEEAAKRRGSLIHRLLELLPSAKTDDWPEIALKFAADEHEAQDLLSEVSQVLKTPAFSRFFDSAALREVPVTATLAELDGRRIHGVIDVLLVQPDHILAVDFKSNTVVPATAETCPLGLLQQMGAYALALAQVYPNHRIETALLWTKSAQLMMLPHDLVTQSVINTHIS